MIGYKISSDEIEPGRTYGRICGHCCGATTVPLGAIKETNGLLVVVEGESPILEEVAPPKTKLHRNVVTTMEGPVTIYWSTYEAYPHE